MRLLALLFLLCSSLSAQTLINPYLFAAPSPGGDPHFASVTYLVNQAGANGSKPTPAVVGGTINYTGNAALTTSSAPLTYSSSLALDGSGDVAWLASGVGSYFAGDFTVELFFKPSGTANNSRLVDIGANSFMIFLDGVMSNAALYVYGSGFYQFSGVSLGNIGTSTWRHVALTKSGTTVRLFFDGVEIGSRTTPTAFGSSGSNGVTLGSYFKGDSSFFNGLIGPFRVTNGVARYTSGPFTPAAFPES